MLRVTPIYGSRYSTQATEPSCTLVEYGGCRILWNVGWWSCSATTASTNAATTTTQQQQQRQCPSFPDLPDHDCLVITDSTIQAIGGLPMYYKQMREKQRRRKQQQEEERRIQEELLNQGGKTNPMYKRRNSSSKSGGGDGGMKDHHDGAGDHDTNHATILMYTTYPTVQMGQMTLYDHHAAICYDGCTDPPYTLEDVDDAFSNLKSIKYSQPITIVGGCSEGEGSTTATSGTKESSSLLDKKSNSSNARKITITAHRGGYVVGNAFFILTRLQDDTSVVLTSNFCVAKELHLESSTLTQYGSTPDVLVTHPGGVSFRRLRGLAHPSPLKLYKSPAPLAPTLISQSERNLVENVLSVLRRDGHVLLPVDASGRVLELILLLYRTWKKQHLFNSYNLVWYAPLVNNTIEYAKSQLEWMHPSLGHQFDSATHAHGHPYALQGVKRISTMREFNALMGDAADVSGNNGVDATGAMGGMVGAAGETGDGGMGVGMAGAGTGSSIKAGGGDGGASSLPTCVLASGLSLDHGPSRDVLLKFADDPDNAVIFTDSSQCYMRNIFNQESSAGTTRADTASTKADDDAVILTPSSQNADAGGEGNAGAGADDNATTVTTVTAASEDSNRVSEWTVAGQLLLAWGQSKYEGREMDDAVIVDIPVPIRQPLRGAELAAYNAEQEKLRQLEREKQEQLAIMREVELAKGQLRLGGGGGSGTGGGADQPQDAGGATVSSAVAADGSSAVPGKNQKSAGGATTGASGRPRKKSRFDQTLFLKFSKPLHLTFEVREEAVGLGQADSIAKYGIGESIGRSGEVLEDDYGIAVIPEKFTDIVSGVDPSKFAGGSGRIGEEVLKRGLGYGVGIDSSKGKRPRKPNGPGAGGFGGPAPSSLAAARVSEDEDQDDIDDLDNDEQATEAMDLSMGTGIIRGRNGRPPTKVSTVMRKLEVLAEINFIPLEGKVDARAARQSVRALQPRQVVVLGGPRRDAKDADENDPALRIDEVSLLSTAAFSFATDKKPVQVPSDGDTAELDVGHAAYAVRLIDAPYQSREDKESGKEPPDPIEPYEEKLGACTVSVLDAVATGQKVALDGSIVLAPRQQRSGIDNDAPKIYLSDGEVLLTDLRAELIAAGLKAEYSAQAGYSQLVVNGKIVVKKLSDDSGEINVEGPLCEDFFTVRAAIAGQFVAL